MRKIQEVLRLHAAGHSQQDISRSCGIGRSPVGEYLQRAHAAGLIWPLPDDLDTDGLERRLFPPAALAVAVRGLPDWATVRRELRRPGFRQLDHQAPVFDIDELPLYLHVGLLLMMVVPRRSKVTVDKPGRVSLVGQKTHFVASPSW